MFDFCVHLPDFAVISLDFLLLLLLCGFIVVWFGIAGNALYNGLLDLKADLRALYVGAWVLQGLFCLLRVAP